MCVEHPLALRVDVARLDGEAVGGRVAGHEIVDRQLHPLDAFGVGALADERHELVRRVGILLERDPAIVVVPKHLLVLQQALTAHLVPFQGHGFSLPHPPRADPL
jgi:hypothetical protein